MEAGGVRATNAEQEKTETTEKPRFLALFPLVAPVLSSLMPKMPRPSKHHRQPAFIASLDGILVAERATRLNDRGDASFGGRVDVVAERKEGVRRHDRAFAAVAGLST